MYNLGFTKTKRQNFAPLLYLEEKPPAAVKARFWYCNECDCKQCRSGMEWFACRPIEPERRTARRKCLRARRVAGPFGVRLHSRAGRETPPSEVLAGSSDNFQRRRVWSR